MSDTDQPPLRSMPALDCITIEGFRSIKRIERLPLGPINVLIGPNGAGKSNFIGAFSFLAEIRAARLAEYVVRSGGADRILHFGANATPKLRIHVSFGGEVNRYGITLTATDTDGLLPVSEECVEYRDGHPLTVKSAGGYGPEAWISQSNTHGLDDELVDRLREHLDDWRIYHFHDTGATSPLKKTAEVNDNRFLRRDGANLAAFLYYLSRKHTDSYNLIRRTVQLVAPFFDDFRLEPLALNEETIRLEWKHQVSDVYFAASSLSDGSLRFIALATVLLQPVSLRPSVILLDEPELGLHPAAITILAALVKQVSVETQVVLSTQSSLLLDHFRPEDVLVADRVQGATTLRRLDAGRLERWLKDYSLGQLWRKNELGGRPASESTDGGRTP